MSGVPGPEEIFEKSRREGARRLERPFVEVASTALAAGFDIAAGVILLGVLSSALAAHFGTDAASVAGALGFGVGFIYLIVGRGELFTENFLVPVAAVVAARDTVWSLLRLWGATLALNLVGGWGFTWLVVRAFPDLLDTARAAGTHYAQLGVSVRSLALAVLAGVVITLMTRMQHATESLGVQLVPAVLFGALLAAGGLFHSVLDSLLMFAALHAGSVPFGYADWAGALAWSVFGNLLGGVALVTFIRLVRVPHRVAEERRRNT